MLQLEMILYQMLKIQRKFNLILATHHVLCIVIVLHRKCFKLLINLILHTAIIIKPK